MIKRKQIPNLILIGIGLRPNDTNKELIYSSTSHSPVSSKNARRDERKDSNIYSIESVADSSNYSGN